MKKSEICQHCGDDYVPKRRGVQKFCSNSCRSRSWILKQSNNKVPIIKHTQENKLTEFKDSIKTERMSLAGIGNAAVGSAITEIGKNLLTPAEKKLATKKDIEELKSLLKGERFLLVKNIETDMYGKKPYYDIKTGNIVYL